MACDRSRNSVLVALALVLAAACGRDEPAPKGGVVAVPPAPARAAVAPAEAAALTRALEPRLSPPPGGWRAIRDARGREVIRGPRFQGMTIATSAADGSLRVQCVSSTAEAAAFLGAAQPAQGRSP
jgi:hypothetical protein